MIEESFLIDSNIIVYAYNLSEGRKHEIAEEILEDGIGRNAIFHISSQNLSEFFVIVTRKISLPLKINDELEVIRIISNIDNFRKINYTNITVKHAIILSVKYKIHYWDALIAATMIENSVFNIYTENVKDFNKIPGINAVNPF